MHLILGSAQLGLNYGFSKKLYKSEKKINQILSQIITFESLINQKKKKN